VKQILLPLILGLLILAYLSVEAFDRLTIAWFTKDADVRSQLAASAVSKTLFELTKSKKYPEIHDILTRMTRDDRLYAIGYCVDQAPPIVATDLFPTDVNCARLNSSDSLPENVLSDIGELHLTRIEVAPELPAYGYLLFVHDMSFATRRGETTSRYLYALFFIVGIFVALFTILIIRLKRRDWISGIRTLIESKGQIENIPHTRSNDMFPVLHELRQMISDLEMDRRNTDSVKVLWAPDTLRSLLSSRLSGDEIIIVSNREPYIHNRIDGRVVVQHPASGLVTALEPVMRACRGTWIAHGSGTADRDVVDSRDCVWVPPGEKEFKLRRLWLSPEEEEGYYYGFSNEGLWPLCHIAHNRPNFRSRDWSYYQSVNARFAQAIVEEAKSESPVILVQDYHYAVLPALVRARIPDAIIITFWHIPWPNPEAFGICPWRQEILRGLLGSTILGFHTRYHRNNFLETVDRFLECRIDREHSAISYANELTLVRHYPISIEWPPEDEEPVDSAENAKAIRSRYQLPPECRIAIGVERLDYTKGILERFAAVARFLELYPSWIGKFTLIQVAAPSRAAIEAYSRLSNDVKNEVKRINTKFSSSPVPPIIYINRHFDQDEIIQHFKVADVCMVTSLHDGMNLVAKEFVASRSDEKGVLILSMFAGASRELPEALLINPYNADQTAEAIYSGLTMPQDEQQARMKSMRQQVREFNVYRWAGRMLLDAAQARDKRNLARRLSDTDAALYR
jgi:trehalose 6-phosphate synthase